MLLLGLQCIGLGGWPRNMSTLGQHIFLLILLTHHVVMACLLCVCLCIKANEKVARIMDI